MISVDLYRSAFVQAMTIKQRLVIALVNAYVNIFAENARIDNEGINGSNRVCFFFLQRINGHRVIGLKLSGKLVTNWHPVLRRIDDGEHIKSYVESSRYRKE